MSRTIADYRCFYNTVVRSNESVTAPHRAKSGAGIVGEMPEILRAEVGRLVPLEVSPDVFDRNGRLPTGPASRPSSTLRQGPKLNGPLGWIRMTRQNFFLTRRGPPEQSPSWCGDKDP